MGTRIDGRVLGDNSSSSGECDTPDNFGRVGARSGSKAWEKAAQELLTEIIVGTELADNASFASN